MAKEIDLSKVKNLDVDNEVLGGEIEVPHATKKKKGSSKFNFVQDELIPLPSAGRFYNSEDEDVNRGYIKIRPMTVAEEEILSTKRFLAKGVATRMILDNCIQSDIEAKDLLSYDSTFLLYQLRAISYGSEYNFTLKCNNSMCEKEFKVEYDLSRMQVEEIPEEFEEPIITVLPVSKYTVKSVLPRIFHGELLTLERETKTKPKGVHESDTQRVEGMIATTLEILDERGSAISRKDWKEFFEALPTKDRAFLSDSVDLDFGGDEIEAECPHCGTKQKRSIPIGIEFFRL